MKGTGAGVLSVETGVRMLQDAGYPIKDAQHEIERIQASAFEQAARLAEATGDNAAVRHYLGLPEAGLKYPRRRWRLSRARAIVSIPDWLRAALGGRDGG